jgi:hypothetical protein
MIHAAQNYQILASASMISQLLSLVLNPKKGAIDAKNDNVSAVSRLRAVVDGLYHDRDNKQ